MRKRTAFTLLELLVVIAIISLLLVILLPTLSQARSTAHRVKCMAHLKQVGTALEIYADTNGDRQPAWSQWHVWGFYGTPADGTGGDDVGAGWTEQLHADGALPGIDIYRCPSFPAQVQVSYFLAAHAAWERDQSHTTSRSRISHAAQYVLSGDCTNPVFYKPPFGENAALNINDADMDNASFPALDWNNTIHRGQNNVLFADSHVASYRKFNAAEMTHDYSRLGVDFGEIDTEDEPMAISAYPN